MRISDWSSDVCSSDLLFEIQAQVELAGGDLLIENSAFLHERPGDEDDRDNDDQNAYRHGGQGCEVRATMHPAQEAAIQGHENNGQRAEERRVGKECVRKCRSRWWPDH